MKKIVAVSFLVALFLAILFAFPEFPGLVCQAGEKDNYSTSPPYQEKSRENIEWLVFSATEHQRERQLVMKHEHITPKELERFGEIYIALADLNDDGVQEVFAYWNVKDSCGTLGCSFAIYRVSGHRLFSLLGSEFDPGGFPIFIDIDKGGHQNVFGVLQSKTMGWHDIALHHKEYTRWRWKGEYYDGAGRLQ